MLRRHPRESGDPVLKTTSKLFQTNNGVSMQILQSKSHGNFRVICGYASIFNITDEHNDMIAPGAFTSSLRDQRKIVFLWQHMVDKPIGVVEQIHEDNHGLYIQAKILTDVKCGQEAVSLIESNVVCGLSIGFNPKSYYIDDSGVRVIEDVDLWEISLVTFPANRFAGVTGIKFQDRELSRVNKSIDQALAALTISDFI